jgi:hypothetical protein
MGARLIVAPFDDEMARVAFDAFRHFGKGQAHPAQLNIVDRAVYALARVRSTLLLFKGDDFARTHIASAPRLMVENSETRECSSKEGFIAHWGIASRFRALHHRATAKQ